MQEISSTSRKDVSGRYINDGERVEGRIRHQRLLTDAEKRSFEQEYFDRYSEEVKCQRQHIIRILKDTPHKYGIVESIDQQSIRSLYNLWRDKNADELTKKKTKGRTLRKRKVRKLNQLAWKGMSLTAIERGSSSECLDFF